MSISRPSGHALTRVAALVAAASEACVEPCADKKFNGTLRMDCMSKCVDRYLEASIVVSESYKDKVAELTGVELP